MREVAAEVGVKRQTLWDWHRHPDFKAAVTRFEVDFEKEAHRYAYANRWRRIEALCRRAEEIEALFVARKLQRAEGDDPSVATQIATGHVVKRPKYIGHGKYSERLFEYEADTPLLREYRETLKQIAIETSQWSQQAEVGGSGAVGPLVITERRVRRLPWRNTEPDGEDVDGEFREKPTEPAATKSESHEEAMARIGQPLTPAELAEHRRREAEHQQRPLQAPRPAAPGKK